MSGSAGSWVDVAHLPVFLGKDTPERLMKFLAYKKQGLALMDSSQEGTVVNTSFGGYDDTIKLQTIQAIDLAIERIENTCSSITGVFREKLGGIEQRDAVSNVQVGIRNSNFITKQYYHTMDLITREVLIDILNVSKIVYKNGVTGNIVLGEKLNRVFTALPEHFTITDYDVHIDDSSEIIKEQEIIKQLAIEFTKGNVVDPDIILETVTAKGLTKLKADVLEALGKKKEENNQLNQLTQQVEQLGGELKNITSEAQKLQSQIERLNQEKLALEQQKLEFEKELGWFKAKSEDSFKTERLKVDTKRVELEALQLLDDNKNNDEIKNY